MLPSKLLNLIHRIHGLGAMNEKDVISDGILKLLGIM